MQEKFLHLEGAPKVQEKFLHTQSVGKVEGPPKVLEILKDKRKTTLLCLVLMLSQSEEKL